MNKNICVVLLCNKSFFEKMIDTLQQLLNTGYDGNICIVIGDDLKDAPELNHPLLLNVIIKYFPDIQFSNEFLHKFFTINRSEHWRQKIFQYHKLHLFNTFFKQWNYIFYIDSGCKIFSSINDILDLKKENRLLAHSDAYHTYTWKLLSQFDSNDSIFNTVLNKYNLNIDYFQTTIMLYDTSIITDTTYNDLLKLAEDVKISITNDQGIISLYFTNIHACWEQISLGDDKTWFYDYLIRDFKQDKPHIILKRNKVHIT